MPVTQHQIAEHLGISRISVARALNGHGKVSEENRRLVEQAARELGYDMHSNRAARELIAKRYGRRLKNDVIAVFVPRMENISVRTGAYFSALLDGIEMQAEDAGVDVLLHSYFSARLPRIVAQGHVDSAICLAPKPDLLQELAALDLPVLTFGSFNDGVYGIAPDDRQGAYLATRHLVESGHRAIGYLGHPPDFSASKLRLAGFQEALREAHVLIEPSLIEANLCNVDDVPGRILRLLQRAPEITALVCYNDLFAMRAIRELEAQGKRVPRDISVTGFDDVSVQENFAPAVTSVAFDRALMGRRAVEVLCSAEGFEPRHETVPVELSLRDSTAVVKS